MLMYDKVGYYCSVGQTAREASSSMHCDHKRQRGCWVTCSTVRPRRSFATSVWCVSARPSSQGRPACLMDVSLAAPDTAAATQQQQQNSSKVENTRRP
jgi:hypothetical protein